MANLYATLAEYKAYSTARGQTATTDATDDGVIVDLLDAASRHLDDKTGRQFYPSVETRLFDIPLDSELLLDADLLAVTTLTNGDSTVLTTTDYILEPANSYPKFGIRLKDVSSYAWAASSANSSQQVISVSGVWGYRTKYTQRGWSTGGTLGAAITDTTTLAFTMTAGHTLSPGQIVKIDSEIYNVSTVVTNTITPICRGDNGSTAATHLNGATVYIWEPQEEARSACLELANTAYQRRFGKSTGDSVRYTEAGAIVVARDIPKLVEEFIASFRRVV